MTKLNWMTKACGVFLLWAATAVALPAQTFTTLYSFNGTDGFYPVSALIQATNGDLYGTTPIGGTFNAGSIFKITTGGTFSTLWTFCSEYFCLDGTRPNGIIEGTDGAFYGTTAQGGGYEDGNVFKITSGGKLTPLYDFTGTGPEGYYPFAGLVQGTNGSFYGTTAEGAANNIGAVFTITSSGNLTVLRAFDGMNGAYPESVMIQGTDGNLYGTALYGGVMGFCTQTDGCGTVFKISAGGPLTALYPFCSQSDCMDGFEPEGGLIQGTDGNFYGTTEVGGANNAGTAFKLTPGGTLTTLYSFCSQANCTDGFAPDASLIQDTNGMFYGTTEQGGANTCDIGNGCGTLFSFSVGLKPFVKPKPTSGAVGAVVTILGTNLTGATSVTFNGTAAAFTVVSGSEISTTVPTGASTGKVQVTVSTRTLTSNVPFLVRQ